ncbi:MAG: phosphatase PAP2 family protein [Elusimicrobia bacterium]|nr:phosphatase PAP2 family protein [Elusimicrobiota bacterium]
MLKNWKTAEALTALTLTVLASLLAGRMAWQYGWTAIFESRGLLSLALLTLAYLMAVQFFARHEQASEFWRYWTYLGVILLGYISIGLVLREFPQPSYEKELRLFDQMLGADVYRWAGQGLPRWLSELFGLGYLFYFPYCLGRAFMITTNGNEEQHERFFLGLTIAYSIGFLGYVLFPALGPRYAMGDSFMTDGSWLATAAVALVDRLGSPWAVMPSMHVGATAYILFFDWFNHKRWFWAGLVPALLLWVATMGLGFHYLVDVVTGLIVAWLSLTLTPLLPVWLPSAHQMEHPVPLDKR